MTTNYDIFEAEGTIPARVGTGLTYLKSTAIAWLRAAAALPGRALHLALALKLQSDLEGRDEIRVQRKLVEIFGLDRYAERRALGALEGAGLVLVQRRRGRRPVVTVIGARP